MKGIRYAILLLAGFCMGWFVQSMMGMTMQKFANRRFLDDCQVTVVKLRDVIRRFKLKEKRYPQGVAELEAKGYLDPTDPPVEGMTRSPRWVSQWDGDGGFLYLSSTGRIYLNADLQDDKFFYSDFQRIEKADLFPPQSLE